MALKLTEIKEMNVAELKEQYSKSCLELVELRMKFASRQLDDVSQLRKKKKEVARLLTVQTQKFNAGDSGEVHEKKPKPKIKKQPKSEKAVVEKEEKEEKE
ncbi:MAG: 50S ribosomal protein L29, partial [Candidatus Melainabacteria bacterium]|nr:50S ribosomal protein L29 [Candidatus Melainabacteria bacterium]